MRLFKRVFLVIITLTVVQLSGVSFSANSNLDSQSNVNTKWLNDDLLEQQLTRNDVIDADYARFGHRISVDGDRMAVGAPYSNNNGLVHIYEYDGVNWNITATLDNGDSDVINAFGASVSLNGDQVLVGAPKFGQYSTNSAAYLFQLIDGNWQKVKTFLPKNINLSFSYGAEVYLDSNRLFIRSEENRIYSVHFYEKLNGSWSLSKNIVPADTSDDIEFGQRIAIWNDTLLASAPYDDENGDNSGVVYAFNLFNGNWLQTQKITPDQSHEGAYFGSSLDIEGGRLIIGDRPSINSTAEETTVYYYEKSGLTWQQQQKLVFASSDTTSDGVSVKLDGTRLAVGVDNFSPISDKTGAVFIYDFFNGSWFQQQVIYSAGGANNDRFGRSVTFTKNQILVGATGDDAGAWNSGSVFGFTQENNVWLETDLIYQKNFGSRNEFGMSVGIDEDTVLVGAPASNSSAQGKTLIYERLNSEWTQSQILMASDGSLGDKFGFSVDINDGSALIGAPKDYFNDSSGFGVAYFYQSIEGQWQEQQIIEADDSSVGDWFGFYVKMKDDIVLIGAPGFIKGENAGAVYVFEKVKGVWSQIQKITPPDGSPGDGFGFSVDLFEDKLIIGAPLQSSDQYTESGAAYVFEKINGFWEFSHKLTSSGGNDFNFGLSVSITGDEILVGSPRDDTFGYDAGAVYSYRLINETWVQQQMITHPNPNDFDWFGFSISQDMNNLVIGMYSYGGNQDVVHVFQQSNQHWQPYIEIYDKSDENNSFGFSVEINAADVVVGAPSNDIYGSNSGTAYVYNFDSIFKSDFE